MRQMFLLITMLLFFYQKSDAQVVISDWSIYRASDTNAILKVESRIKGVLLPRLSKVRIAEKQENHVGEMFFSKEDDCLMINVATERDTHPKWRCVANQTEAIPKDDY